MGFALFAISAAIQAQGKEIAYPYSFEMKGNPLVRHISSTDPDVQVWDGVVWMYCSQDHPAQPGDKGVYDRMDGYHAFSSSDLIHWTDHGEVMHSRNIAWAKPGWMWAPVAARKDGKYYLYYPNRDKEDQKRIGVAVADSPTGPFKDIGKPIDGLKGIDPKIFIDDDGQAYLYCNRATIAKLKPNMTELAEPSRKIIYSPENIEKDLLVRFGEGSFMHKKNGIYYFSYANPRNEEYQGYYAMGDNPYGPFEWKGPFVPKPSDAQNHHSIIEFKGKWYFFYHINTPKEQLDAMGWNGSRRIACFDRIFYNEDGTIKMVEHTTDWVPGKTD
jgi:beta-xylosidase